MDAQSYSRLLSYIVCEITMPIIIKHVFNYFAASNQTSMNPQVLCAATLTAKSQMQKNSQTMTHKLTNSKNLNVCGLEKENDSKTVIQEIPVQELCEGTEIEKSALGAILNCDAAEESDTNTTQPEPKRRRYSAKEDEQAQDTITEIAECLEETDSGSSCPITARTQTDSTDNTLFSDPLLLCSDDDFKVMFRMSRSTFKILVEMLSEEELEPIEDVPLYKKVLIVLWLLGTSGSYKDAAQVFEVSEEAVSSCFFDICATLYNKSENFIKWPSHVESDEIASRIENKFGFPGVVGILGCQYFTISIPKESLSRREHFNGKLRMYCVALQLVCDDEFLIRDIFPGLAGSIRPPQLLRDSPLGEGLSTQPTQLIDSNKHILARAEFPQLTSMLTPYTKKSESLTSDEEDFNTLHENVCLLMDQTFKMLKDRFRILKRLDPEVATMVLVTTCVLHNICMQYSDIYDIEETASSLL